MRQSRYEISRDNEMDTERPTTLRDGIVSALAGSALSLIAIIGIVESNSNTSQTQTPSEVVQYDSH
ncbi:MAG: hypothetical protein KA604_01195 [Candidatus Saccharimonas sp.]|nr:hypothetical protein [Candidatus Saccharimonas sp.]